MPCLYLHAMHAHIAPTAREMHAMHIGRVPTTAAQQGLSSPDCHRSAMQSSFLSILFEEFDAIQDSFMYTNQGMISFNKFVLVAKQNGMSILFLLTSTLAARQKTKKYNTQNSIVIEPWSVIPCYMLCYCILYTVLCIAHVIGSYISVVCHVWKYAYNMYITNIVRAMRYDENTYVQLVWIEKSYKE